jgi:hypothetical protein
MTKNAFIATSTAVAASGQPKLDKTSAGSAGCIKSQSRSHETVAQR